MDATLLEGLSIAVAGIAFTLYRLRVLWTAWGSVEWPKASGTIVSATVEKHPELYNFANYTPEVTYHYSVAETLYTGTRLRFGSFATASLWAEDQLAHYRPGTNVTVYYDVDKPSRSVLEPGAKWPLYALLLPGALMTSAGLLVLQSRM